MGSGCDACEGVSMFVSNGFAVSRYPKNIYADVWEFSQEVVDHGAKVDGVSLADNDT